MGDYLSLADLFLVGLVLDITGAILLAKGLVLHPATIYGVTAQLLGGNDLAIRDRCQSRTDAEFGVSLLASGFCLQAIGYGLEIGGIESRVGIERLLVAAILAFAASGLGCLVYTRFQGRRTESLFREAIAAKELTRRNEAEREAARRAPHDPGQASGGSPTI